MKNHHFCHHKCHQKSAESDAAGATAGGGVQALGPLGPVKQTSWAGIL